MASTQLFSFFKEEISYANKKQNLKIDKGTELYLTQLMSNEIDGIEDISAYLIDIYLDCVSTKNKKEAFIKFRKLGDISLFKAGYFYENIFSKATNLNYYIEMGKKGYNMAGNLSNENIYFILRDDYIKCLCILNFIVENKKEHSKKDLERLHQFYIETLSPGNKEFLKKIQTNRS